ncbi:MAG: pyrroline-5-carboxylate reductase [Campylobacterales bacterium]|nr:pyrroline-5-carboxylate reductase [Campylobacterales bacterium]
MAKAMIEGLVNSYEIEVIGKDMDKLRALNAVFEGKLSLGLLQEGVDATGKTLILCVKPHALEAVAPHFRGEAHGLISVLAGTPLHALQKAFTCKHFIRAMPNLAAAHRASMTLLTGDVAFQETAQHLLQSIGKTHWLGTEKEFDIAMALTGSGPAFLALVAEALCDGVVREGLKREDATLLVRGLFEGFAPLLRANHPALIKEAVMSPGGVTAAGLGVLEERGVRSAFMETMKKTYEKTLK